MAKFERMILRVEGMTCVGCENRIESKLKKTDGILSAKANYNDQTLKVTFSTDTIRLKEIDRMLSKMGYHIHSSDVSGDASKNQWMDLISIGLVLMILYLFAQRFGLLTYFSQFPEAKEGMSYGVLFGIGVLTSVHCVAMCGGINLSQSIAKTPVDTNKTSAINAIPSFYYNAGRVVSYTVIGALVGALGSLVSFPGPLKGVVAIVAGGFMVLMGINLLNLFPSLRKFTPRMPKAISHRIGAAKLPLRSRPFMIGLLNGLMPCGPLQAMQLYALSTGDPIKGGLAMLAFSLGTVPLMFGLGAISSMLTHAFTKKMTQVSAVLVIVLGFSMFQTGMTVSGISLPGLGGSNASQNVAIVEDGIQTVTTELRGGNYEPITVQVGVPVRWNLHVNRGFLTSCNDRIQIPEYGLEIQLKNGDNYIEFTPTETGSFLFRCWMGMLRGMIYVVD